MSENNDGNKRDDMEDRPSGSSKNDQPRPSRRTTRTDAIDTMEELLQARIQARSQPSCSGTSGGQSKVDRKPQPRSPFVISEASFLRTAGVSWPNPMTRRSAAAQQQMDAAAAAGARARQAMPMESQAGSSREAPVFMGRPRVFLERPPVFLERPPVFLERRPVFLGRPPTPRRSSGTPGVTGTGETAPFKKESQVWLQSELELALRRSMKTYIEEAMRMEMDDEDSD